MGEELEKRLDIIEKKLDKFQGHEHMLDVDEAETYGQYEFLEACKDMGIIKNI